MLGKLSKEGQDLLLQQIVFEMAKVRVGFRIPSLPLAAINITKTVPITNGLNDSFPSYLDEMDSAMAIASGAIVLGLNQATNRTK
jgi:hypothetical protein